MILLSCIIRRITASYSYLSLFNMLVNIRIVSSNIIFIHQVCGINSSIGYNLSWW